MFKFSTTTIINQNADVLNATLGGTTVGGKLFEAKDGVFIVRRVNNFKKDNVKKIYHRPYAAAAPGKAVFDVSTITNDGVYRIHLYIRLAMNSQNSYYANDFVFKGKPFIIEFQVKNGKVLGKSIAEGIAEIVKKYQIMVYEEPLLKVSVNATSVTIQATDEFQVFTTAKLEQYVESADRCCNPEDSWEDFAEAEVTQSVQGFGTYRQLVTNLRLPTAANTRWNKIIADETPVLGGQYDQYILYYCVHRGIMGGDAVGEDVTSTTQHIFWVKSDVKAEFDAAIKTLGTVEEYNKEFTDGKNPTTTEGDINTGDNTGDNTGNNAGAGTNTEGDKEF